MERVFRFSLLRILRIFAAKNPSGPCRLMAATEGEGPGLAAKRRKSRKKDGELPGYFVLVLKRKEYSGFPFCELCAFLRLKTLFGSPFDGP